MLYRNLVIKSHLIKITNKRWKSVKSNTTQKWKTVVGLEIHAQLNTKSKLFSGAENKFGAVVNSCVSLFDASIPGTLPVLNRRCVELGVITALALSCKVNEVSMFDRKHYFYADLPTGYQITQQRAPLASCGKLDFQVYTPGIHKKPYMKTSKLLQIQLEQDSGKSLHNEEAKQSLVDLNRAGAPLIELVFEPDLEDGEEAAALVKELVLIVQRLGSCSGRMEEGALRCDANVSINKVGEPLGTRTEIKNIGSIRGVAGAVNYEIERQISVKEAGGTITNETRMWDAAERKTIVMRDKEVAQDYRFMPEPNLPPLRLNLSSKSTASGLISVPMLKENIPELPEQTRQNLVRKYNIRPEIAIQLVNEDCLLDYFLELTKNEKRDPKKVANMLFNELITSLNKHKIELYDCKLHYQHMGDILDLLQNKLIDNSVVCKILYELIKSNDKETVKKIVEKNDWLLVVDESSVIQLCEDVIRDNPNLVQQYREGKKKVFKALMGIAAKQSKNKMAMVVISQKLEEILKK